MSISLLCLIVAVVVLGIAAFVRYWYPGEPKIHLVAVGLFFWALADLLGGVHP